MAMGVRLPAPYPMPVISSHGTLNADDACIFQAAFGTSTTWPTANKAFFLAWELLAPYTVRRLWVYNGAAVSGNLDVGLYSHDGTRLVSSGSTAQAGTNTLQLMDVTDVLLAPGLYYLALCLDNTTGAVMSAPATLANAARGGAQMLTAFPLPTVATLATVSAGQRPHFGLTSRASIL